MFLGGIVLSNILVIDEYKALGKVLVEYVSSKYGDNYRIETLSSTSDALSKLKSTIYDVVVINCANFNNNDLIDKVTLYNKKQKLIVISSDAKCSDSLGCNHCQENYNKIRLIPPFLEYNIADYIINPNKEQCPHFGHCEEYKFKI